MADGLGSMGPQVDAYKKSLLEATATGGSAGAKAFKDAQAALGVEQQAAVGRAASRAALIGGPESQGFEAIPNQYYGRGIANLQSAGASFDADTARRLSANQNYLSQAAASIPSYRAETDRLVGLKKASAETKATKSAAEDISLDELLGLATQAQTAAKPTAPVDFGPAQAPGESIEAYLARLETAAQGRRDTDAVVNAPLSDVAKTIGRGLGVGDITLAGLDAPGKQSATKNAQDNLAPAQQDAVAKALATKYDTKGVTYDLAKSVVNNVDFQAAVDFIAKGAVDPETGEPMTRSQLEAWLRREFITKDGRNWQAEYNILTGEYLSKFADE